MQTIGLLLGVVLIAVALYGVTRLRAYPSLPDDEQITR